MLCYTPPIVLYAQFSHKIDIHSILNYYTSNVTSSSNFQRLNELYLFPYISILYLCIFFMCIFLYVFSCLFQMWFVKCVIEANSLEHRVGLLKNVESNLTEGSGENINVSPHSRHSWSSKYLCSQRTSWYWLMLKNVSIQII